MSRSTRKRIVIRSAIVAFVVVFGWIGVLVALQLVADETYNFKPEIQRTMAQIRDGRARELYWESSPRMRKAFTEDTFYARATELNQTLGEFKEILGTSDAVVHDRAQGKTGWVRATLKFAFATTSASFSWHWDPEANNKKGQWRLFGYYIEVPPPLDEKLEKRKQRKQARSEAPAEVVELVETIMGKLRDGKVEDVYDEAHPSFKDTVRKKQFIDREEVRRREMGGFVRILDITSHGRDENLKKAWVTAVFEYGKTQTTGTIDFWNTDGTWRISRFMIQIPEISVPRRPTLPGLDAGPESPSPSPKADQP